MSYLRDFEKLHISTKTSIMTVLVTIPFFFIAIYLFKPSMVTIIKGNIFTNIHFYYLLSICVMTSVLWYLMNLWLGLQTTEYIVEIDRKKRKKNKKKESTKKEGLTEEERGLILKKIEDQKEVNLLTTFYLTFIYSLVYLSLAILLNKEWLHLEFKWFVIACYSFVFFRIIWIAIVLAIVKRN